MNISKRTQLKGLSVLFLITLIPLIFGLLTNSIEHLDNSIEKGITQEKSDLGLALPPSTYDWWNNSWNFRVPVGITAIGGQQDAPVLGGC